MDIKDAISIIYTPEEIAKINASGRAAVKALEREKLRAFLAQVDTLVVPECEIREQILHHLDHIKNRTRSFIEKEAA